MTETINSDTVINYAYDLNGNMVSKGDGSDTTLYEWDWENRLVQMTNDQIPMTNYYEYDGDGNRIQKTEVRGQTTETTKYINDVASPLVQVLMETNESDTVLATYTYGNDLISMNRAGVNSYYHYDGLGTVRQMTDDTETIVASYTYDSFGNLIASSGATTNAYGFTGEQQFEEVDNLVFLRARYYDASIGRFISRDPIHYWGGINLYGYVKNNPVNYIDPLGTMVLPWQLWIIEAIAGFNIGNRIGNICTSMQEGTDSYVEILPSINGPGLYLKIHKKETPQPNEECPTGEPPQEPKIPCSYDLVTGWPTPYI